jgi:hypothetical protein
MATTSTAARRMIGLSVVLVVLMLLGYYMALMSHLMTSKTITMTTTTTTTQQEENDGTGTRRRTLGSNSNINMNIHSMSANVNNPIPKWDPPRLDYESIVMGYDEIDEDIGKEPLLLKALHEVGIIAVNQITYYSRNVQDAMNYDTFHKCAVTAAHSSGNSSQLLAKELFLDHGRTVRRTIATQDYPTYVHGHTGGMEVLEFTDEAKAVCQEFEKASETLRKMMTRAVRSFSNRLGSELKRVAHLPSPLMTTTQAQSNSTHNYTEVYRSVNDVVMHGHHLEHFHTYQQVKMSQSSSSSSSSKSTSISTIDMHTDQGLFIAFVPGRVMTEGDKSNTGTTTQMSEGFYIQLPNGTIVEPQFQSDDLVFMLGEGVNHIINPLLVDVDGSKHQLRPVPHRLDMHRNYDHDHDDEEESTASNKESQNQARVWYGRMVLPPPGAYSKIYDTTYQHIRSQLIAASTSVEVASASALLGAGENDNSDNKNNIALQEPYSIGCASLPSDTPKEHIQRLMRQRQLRQYDDQTVTANTKSEAEAEADDMCDSENDVFCWHRTMLHVGPGNSRGTTVSKEEKMPK